MNNAPTNGDMVEQRIVQKVRRYSFSSLDFMDIADVPSADKEIVQVETVRV
jgi:hypothetical protein